MMCVYCLQGRVVLVTVSVVPVSLLVLCDDGWTDGESPPYCTGERQREALLATVDQQGRLTDRWHALNMNLLWSRYS